MTGRIAGGAMRGLLLFTMVCKLWARKPFDIVYISENDTIGCIQLNKDALVSFVDVRVHYEPTKRKNETVPELYATWATASYSDMPNKVNNYTFFEGYTPLSTFYVYEANGSYALIISSGTVIYSGSAVLWRDKAGFGRRIVYVSSNYAWDLEFGFELDCKQTCTYQSIEQTATGMNMAQFNLAKATCLFYNNSDGEVGCTIDDSYGLLVVPNGGPVKAKYSRHGYVVYHGRNFTESMFVKRIGSDVCYELYSEFSDNTHYIQLPTLSSRNLFPHSGSSIIGAKPRLKTKGPVKRNRVTIPPEYELEWYDVPSDALEVPL